MGRQRFSLAVRGFGNHVPSDQLAFGPVVTARVCLRYRYGRDAVGTVLYWPPLAAIAARWRAGLTESPRHSPRGPNCSLSYRAASDALQRFSEKCEAVFRKEARQNKDLEAFGDSKMS